MDTIELPVAASDLDHARATLELAGFSIVAPRLSPTERAEDAIEGMAFELTHLESALKAGAVLSPQKRTNLAAFVTMLRRIGAVE